MSLTSLGIATQGLLNGGGAPALHLATQGLIRLGGISRETKRPPMAFISSDGAIIGIDDDDEIALISAAMIIYKEFF